MNAYNLKTTVSREALIALAEARRAEAITDGGNPKIAVIHIDGGEYYGTRADILGAWARTFEKRTEFSFSLNGALILSKGRAVLKLLPQENFGYCPPLGFTDSANGLVPMFDAATLKAKAKLQRKSEAETKENRKSCEELARQARERQVYEEAKAEILTIDPRREARIMARAHRFRQWEKRFEVFMATLPTGEQVRESSLATMFTDEAIANYDLARAAWDKAEKSAARYSPDWSGSYRARNESKRRKRNARIAKDHALSFLSVYKHGRECGVGYSSRSSHLTHLRKIVRRFEQLA